LVVALSAFLCAAVGFGDVPSLVVKMKIGENAEK